MIALVGSDWNPVDPTTGRGSLENADDFVRLELECAFEHDRKVLAVTVDGAPEPSTHRLPESIQKLSSIQATDVGHRQFGRDADHLRRHIQENYLRIPEGSIKVTRGFHVIGMTESYDIEIGKKYVGSVGNNETRIFTAPVGRHLMWAEHTLYPNPNNMRSTRTEPKTTASNQIFVTITEQSTPVVRVRSTIGFGLKITLASP